MRTAAGILMIISVIIGFSFTRGVLRYIIPPVFGYIIPPLFGFVFYGIFSTFKRKHWWVCLAASILSGGILFPLAILPTIFVCLRKREWES